MHDLISLFKSHWGIVYDVTKGTQSLQDNFVLLSLSVWLICRLCIVVLCVLGMTHSPMLPLNYSVGNVCIVRNLVDVIICSFSVDGKSLLCYMCFRLK